MLAAFAVGIIRRITEDFKLFSLDRGIYGSGAGTLHMPGEKPGKSRFLARVFGQNARYENRMVPASDPAVRMMLGAGLPAGLVLPR